MYTAYDNFKHSIRDATDLLEHFDRVNVQPPPENAEVQKLASMLMALTALETYIEDRITESAALTAQGAKKSPLGRFYVDSLSKDLRFFHSPSTDRVRNLEQIPKKMENFPAHFPLFTLNTPIRGKFSIL